jgi:hypothetical protein
MRQLIRGLAGETPALRQKSLSGAFQRFSPPEQNYFVAPLKLFCRSAGVSPANLESLRPILQEAS